MQEKPLCAILAVLLNFCQKERQSKSNKEKEDKFDSSLE